MTSPVPASYEPEWRLLESLCLGIETPAGARQWDDLIHADLQWGLVLEFALRHRVLTLLADGVVRTGAASKLPLRVTEHLRGVLALNRYRRTVWYRELGRVLSELRAADVVTAVRKGGAYESTVYGGDGRRWIGDIDLLIRPDDQLAAAEVLRRLGYEQGIFNEDTGQVVPFTRPELIRYQLNPDHLPTYSLRTGDPLVPVVEVDFATSLTWARSSFQLPVDDVLDVLEAVEVRAGATVTVPTALPEFQFVDTVLHLFKEAWFEWWLDKEQDVDLMKFGDVIRLAERYQDVLSDRLGDLAERYGIATPVAWVLEHLDRTFGTGLVAQLGMAGHTTEAFLASAAASGPDVPVWHADMRARLRATDRRGLLAVR